MKLLTQSICCMLGAVALALLLPGCPNREETKPVTRINFRAKKNPNTPIRIGISIPSADHGWTGGVIWWARRAISDWKQRDKNATFFLATAPDAMKQIGDVEDLLTKEVDALVILPHDSAPLTPIVEQAKERGTYVVVVDRGLSRDVQDVYVSGDNPGLGRVSAEWMAKELGGRGKMVVLEGVPCRINTERVDAFRKIIKNKYPAIEILDSQPSYWSTQRGLEIMDNYLQKYKHIDAVWAQDDDVLKGVLEAYRESGRKEVKVFLGGAGSKDIIKRVMDGDPMIRADVTYPPSMIATAISIAVRGVRGQGVEGFYQRKAPSRIVLAAELVTHENAGEYYEPDSAF